MKHLTPKQANPYNVAYGKQFKELITAEYKSSVGEKSENLAIST